MSPRDYFHLRHHGHRESEDTRGRSGSHGSKDNNDQSSQEGPVGFWSRDLNKVKLQILTKWAVTTLVLCVFILAVLSLYWAVLFHYAQNLPSLTVWVVDFDSQVAPYTSTTPLVGPQLVAAALEQNNSPMNHLGFVARSPQEFDFDPLNVRREIYHQHAWAAFIINANATSLLQAAVTNGNASFDPLGMVQLIYVEARDQMTYDEEILPLLNQFMMQFPAMFGREWVATTLRNAAGNTTAMEAVQAAPQALNPAVGFSIFNLRPFNPPVETPAVTVGLIYLIIFSFFSFAFYMPIYSQLITPSPSNSRTLHFYQLIIFRLIATITTYFFLSFFYSLISLIFQIPFTHPPGSEVEVASPANAYGKGSFVVYWMLIWVGMGALGLACENVAMIVGQPWAALWLIFWVITNVCSSFYNITLAPRFYYWAYAWPLHNVVEAGRTILFDTHSRVGLNFGVLFAWTAVNIAFFPFCCYFMRWKTQRSQKKEEEKKKDKS